MQQPEEREVAIATFPSETEALMVAEILEDHGIPVVLVPLGTGIGGFGATTWRPFALRVRSGDAERARQLLESLQHDSEHSQAP